MKTVLSVYTSSLQWYLRDRFRWYIRYIAVRSTTVFLPYHFRRQSLFRCYMRSSADHILYLLTFCAVSDTASVYLTAIRLGLIPWLIKLRTVYLPFANSHHGCALAFRNFRFFSSSSVEIWRNLICRFFPIPLLSVKSISDTSVPFCTQRGKLTLYLGASRLLVEFYIKLLFSCYSVLYTLLRFWIIRSTFVLLPICESNLGTQIITGPRKKRHTGSSSTQPACRIMKYV